jgi:hypothetical protein
MADRVASCDVNEGLTCSSPRKGLLLLMHSQLELAAELHASRLGSLSALGCPRKDQMPFELS